MQLASDKKTQIDDIIAQNQSILTKAGGITMADDGTLKL
jgi:hypothetical protein